MKPLMKFEFIFLPPVSSQIKFPGSILQPANKMI